MKGYHYIKRGIDIILSGMAIVILSPLLSFFMYCDQTGYTGTDII